MTTVPLRSRLPRWLLVGLLLRLLLVPFHHPWDLQAWHNVFVDLSRDHSPYETLREMSYSARAYGGLGAAAVGAARVVQRDFYEYYAYPPLPILVYYPLAKLAAALAPIGYQFSVQSGAVLAPVPLVVPLLLKLPLFAADVAIAALLWRLANQAAARAFFLNPLAILISGAWMIDALQVAAALAALYLVTRQREALAGMALALGALVKWLPALLWPTIALWMLRQRIPLRRQLAFHLTFLVTIAIVVVPFWEGTALALQFHAVRPGANLTPHLAFHAIEQLARGDQSWLLRTVSPLLGALTLPLALGLAYAAQWRRRLPLPAAASLTVVAFFLGSKLVNETYLLLLLPLLLWELARRPSEETAFVFRAAYGIAFAFAMLSVPLVGFATPALLHLAEEVPRRAFDLSRLPARGLDMLVLLVFALAFVGVCAYAWRVLMKEGERATVRAASRGSHRDRSRVPPADRAVGPYDGPALEAGRG